jgi:hypothetical protein
MPNNTSGDDVQNHKINMHFIDKNYSNDDKYKKYFFIFFLINQHIKKAQKNNNCD